MELIIATTEEVKGDPPSKMAKMVPVVWSFITVFCQGFFNFLMLI